MPLILLNSFQILKYSHHENFDSTKSSQRFSCNVNKIAGSSVLSSNHCHKDQTNVFTLWHNRLGHPSSPVEKSIMMNCNVPNINKFSFLFYVLSWQNIYSSSGKECQTPLEFIRIDLWAPASAPSTNRYRLYSFH